MIMRFLEGLKKKKRMLGSAAVPAATRVYAIGDIHGQADLLARLHGQIQRDALDFDGDRLVVVYLGDYVDRGLKSREVIDCLIDRPLNGFESIYLKGNHEEALLDFLADPRRGADWMAYGGDATLLSYGVGLEGPRTHPATLERAREILKRNLPARHLDFFRNLRLSHEEGDFLFVHAGIRPGVKPNEQSAHDMLWIRNDFLDSRADFGKVVVHGHSISGTPEERPNRIGIDTGAFMSDCLTAVVIEDAAHRFLQTGT